MENNYLVEILGHAMKVCYDDLDPINQTIIDEGDDGQKQTDRNLVVKLYFECSFKKSGLLADDGTLNVTQLTKALQKSKGLKTDLVNGTVEACKDVKGADGGDTAVKVYNCLGRQKVIA